MQTFKNVICKLEMFLFIQGHLDRVVHGQTAEEILSACDENTVTISVGDNVGVDKARGGRPAAGLGEGHFFLFLAASPLQHYDTKRF